MTALPPGADRSTGLTQWVTRLVAAFGAVVLAVLAWSGVASAHAALETADPGQSNEQSYRRATEQERRPGDSAGYDKIGGERQKPDGLGVE